MFLPGQLQVAFSVAKPVDGNIGPASAVYALVHRDVVSNIGNAYSPITGQYSVS